MHFEVIAKGLSQPSEPQNIIETPKSPEASQSIPDWIKNNAKWWSARQIDDADFVNGIQFMLKENIIKISNLPQKSTPKFVDPNIDPQHYINRYNNEPEYKSWFDKNYPGYTIYEVVGVTEPLLQKVPDWVRNNAGWWAKGQIAEEDFVNAIQYLVEQGIIRV